MQRTYVEYKIPHREFIRMWYEDGMTVRYLAKHFNVSKNAICWYAKRCKLEREKPEIVPGGLPTDETQEDSQTKA